MTDIYSRETLENVARFLRCLTERPETYRGRGVFFDDLMQAAEFLEAHLDDEDVMSAEQVYFNLK